jgi:hypothetical protein
LANHKQELPMVAMGILSRLSSFREDFLEIDQPICHTEVGLDWQQYCKFVNRDGNYQGMKWL